MLAHCVHPILHFQDESLALIPIVASDGTPLVARTYLEQRKGSNRYMKNCQMAFFAYRMAIHIALCAAHLQIAPAQFGFVRFVLRHTLRSQSGYAISQKEDPTPRGCGSALANEVDPTSFTTCWSVLVCYGEHLIR